MTVVALALLFAAGCERQAAGRAKLPAEWRGDAVASVNGVFITGADVALAGKASSHAGPAASPGDREQIIDTLVKQELAAQRAVELGLTLPPQEAEELQRLEAQAAAFRRQRLAEAYYRDAAGKLEISDADARAYYDAHAAELRSEVRVLQILARDEAQIEAIAAELAAGKPFEEVAAARLPEHAAGQRPWDLGYLRWHQIPESWGAVLATMQPGQVSGVIRGANKRFWIIKLVDRRESAAADYASVKPMIMDLLREQRVAALRAQAGEELAKGATVVRAPAR